MVTITIETADERDGLVTDWICENILGSVTCVECVTIDDHEKLSFEFSHSRDAALFVLRWA